MPVVAIAGAALAWSGAAAAVGAVASGGLAALTLTGALEITAALGATLGAVGAVTRDKGLMKAGMIIGAVGGIGALAANAGLFGAEASTASLFGGVGGAESTAADFANLPAGAMSAQDFTDVAGNMASASAAGLPAGAMPPEGLTGIVDQLGGANVAAQAAAPVADISGGTGGALNRGAGASDTLSAMPKEVSTSSVSPWTPAAPAAPSVKKTFAEDITSLAQAPGAPNVEAPNLFGKLSNFVTNDKSGMVGYGLIQAGGSLVSGLFNPLTPAQVEQLNAQSAMNRQQLANSTQPLPVARRTAAPVTGKPSSGLINTSGAAA